jgi:histidine triad (HIT) family protein
MKCIFCEIIDGKSPAEIIYENETILAFLDIHPMNYGHTLVIPKEHHPDFSEIPRNILSELVYVVQHIARAVQRGMDCEGYNIVVNNGRVAGQSVFHSHFHVIPRFNSDYHLKLNLKKYPGSSIQEYAEKIRKEINYTRRENE